MLLLTLSTTIAITADRLHAMLYHLLFTAIIIRVSESRNIKLINK